MKRTSVLTALLALSFLIVLAGCAPQAPETTPAQETKTVDKTPIKIGVIAPLVGDTAGYGQDVSAAAQLAVDEINKEGGINGRKLELIIENGGCNGKDATNAANKLINVDKVKVIVGGYCSAETLAAAPLAEKAGVVLLSPASSNPAITDAGDFIFRITPSDALQGEAIAKEIYEQGITKVAVTHVNSDYNLALANAFKKNFEALGGEITTTEIYEQDAKDFRTQVAKMRASRPEGIYMVPYAEGGLLVKQIRELRIDVPLFGAETFNSKDIIEDAGEENIEGLVFATPRWNEDSPKAKQFLQKVQQYRGGDLTLPVFAANSYDAVRLVAEAIKNSPGKEVSSESIKDYLYTVKDWDGAGGRLTIDENGDALKDFQIMIIHNGKPQKKSAPPVGETVAAKSKQ